MNKGNLEAELRAELAAEVEAQQADEVEEMMDYDPDDGYDDWRDDRYIGLFDDYDDLAACYDAWEESQKYDWAWDDSYDDWWYRRDTDDFAHDAARGVNGDVAAHYEVLWVKAGYVPRPPIPFPFPMRAWVEVGGKRKLVDCYKPPF